MTFKWQLHTHKNSDKNAKQEKELQSWSNVSFKHDSGGIAKGSKMMIRVIYEEWSMHKKSLNVGDDK